MRNFFFSEKFNVYKTVGLTQFLVAIRLSREKSLRTLSTLHLLVIFYFSSNSFHEISIRELSPHFRNNIKSLFVTKRNVQIIEDLNAIKNNTNKQ